MAEKIVFGADIDNVTIKNVNGVLVAVGGSEAAEDEVETLSAYTSPVEDDEHYVETTTQWLRHKPTQAVWSAKKSERKSRSAPVNEIISEAIELEPTSYNTTDSNIRLELKHHNYTSGVDGKSLGVNEINSTGASVDIPKSQYANAKAFNEANAGKTFIVTTAKRYAKSEGHPVVKPTEIQVAYPILSYHENSVAYTEEYGALSATTTLNIIPSFKMKVEMETMDGPIHDAEVTVDSHSRTINISELGEKATGKRDGFIVNLKAQTITAGDFYNNTTITIPSYTTKEYLPIPNSRTPEISYSDEFLKEYFKASESDEVNIPFKPMLIKGFQPEDNYMNYMNIDSSVDNIRNEYAGVNFGLKARKSDISNGLAIYQGGKILTHSRGADYGDRAVAEASDIEFEIPVPTSAYVYNKTVTAFMNYGDSNKIGIRMEGDKATTALINSVPVTVHYKVTNVAVGTENAGKTFEGSDTFNISYSANTYTEFDLKTGTNFLAKLREMKGTDYPSLLKIELSFDPVTYSDSFINATVTVPSITFETGR